MIHTAKVMTVRGEISSDDLGITLPHEHLLIDNRWEKRTDEGARKSRALIESDPSLKNLIDAPVTIELLDDLRRYQNLSKNNLKLSDVNDAITEIMKYRFYGGKSIVDLTTPGIGRNPPGLKKISQATGVNVICGTGWYRGIMHPNFVKTESTEGLANIMIQELTEGIGNTGIKAGIIGELGCDVTKVLKAGGQAQSETGVGLSIHTGRRVPYYIEILEKAGANLEKVVISHMDGRYSDLTYQKFIMDKYGVTMEYDTFGTYDNIYRNDFYPEFARPSPTDMNRMEAIVKLVEEGYEQQILISHDVCKKYHLTKYGGVGYVHILRHIVPAFKYLGLTNKQINCILVKNPERILSY